MNSKVKTLKIPVNVPRLWSRRKSETDGRIYYVSPSGHILTNVKQVLAYLDRSSSCKCSLDTRLSFNQVFNFDPSLEATTTAANPANDETESPCEQWCKAWFASDEQRFRLHLFMVLNYLLTENVSDLVEMYEVYIRHRPPAIIDFADDDDDHDLFMYIGQEDNVSIRSRQRHKQQNHRQIDSSNNESESLCQDFHNWLTSFDWNLVAMSRNGYQLIKDLQWDNLKHLAYEFQMSGMMDRMMMNGTDEAVENCDNMEDTQSIEEFFEKLAQELENLRHVPNHCDADVDDETRPEQEENMAREESEKDEKEEHSDRSIPSDPLHQELEPKPKEEEEQQHHEDDDGTIKLMDQFGMAFQLKFNPKTINGGGRRHDDDKNNQDDDDDRSPSKDEAVLDILHHSAETSILLLDGHPVAGLGSPPRKRARFLSASEIDDGCSSIPIEVIEDVDDDVIPELLGEEDSRRLSINFELINDDDEDEEEMEIEPVAENASDDQQIPKPSPEKEEFSVNTEESDADQNETAVILDDGDNGHLMEQPPDENKNDETEEKQQFSPADDECHYQLTPSTDRCVGSDNHHSEDDDDGAFCEIDPPAVEIDRPESKNSETLSNQINENNDSTKDEAPDHDDDDEDEDDDEDQNAKDCLMDEFSDLSMLSTTTTGTTNSENERYENLVAIGHKNDSCMADAGSGGINNHDNDTLNEMKSRELYYKRMKRLKSQLEIQGMPGEQSEDDKVRLSPPLPPEKRVFNVGDLVWGPYGDVRFWPGKLVTAEDAGQGLQQMEKSDEHGNKLIVRWFGSNGISTMVTAQSLRTLTEGLEAHHCARKKHRRGKRVNVLLERAIQEAMTELDDSGANR